MFGRKKLIMQDTPDGVEKLRRALEQAQAVVLGAGAGVSTSAGFSYAGERFARTFHDFGEKYGFRDMYSGGFTRFATPEEQWAYWSRNIYVNRYMDPPKPVYRQLLALLRDKDYFVLTTNVDHCFQKAGFDKQRLFYTQGDYGLWQCSLPCHNATYDNAETVRAMVEAQGFVIAPDGALTLPEGVTPKMTVPSQLVPRCPRCGRPMSMNLRADDSFVEDEGWNLASSRYAQYLDRCREKRTLFLEAGVGFNTPGIIKFAFWRMAEEWPRASYACLNYSEACAPEDLLDKSVVLSGDIGDILARL